MPYKHVTNMVITMFKFRKKNIHSAKQEGSFFSKYFGEMSLMFRFLNNYKITLPVAYSFMIVHDSYKNWSKKH